MDRWTGLKFSPDPADYVVRCALCHVLRDRVHRTGGGLKLAETAGWILHRLEQAGRRITTREIYSKAKALGIDDRHLSQARTYFLPNVLSDRRTWWLVPDETEAAETG